MAACQRVRKSHSGDNEVWTEGTKEMLDDMHLRKIDLADEVFVINVGGYIGSSTQAEIAYAKRTGKPVRYLETRGIIQFQSNPVYSGSCESTGKTIKS